MRNYQKELDEITGRISESGNRPTLCLHVCCAPCSSYCMEYLCEFFDITLLFYNPNMDSAKEYEKRKSELLRLVEEAHFPVRTEILDYDPDTFFEKVKGYEGFPEGRERCFICYEMRMRKAAEFAVRNGYDYFTTTLSISPLKNAQKINEIGERLGKEYGIKHLPSDFKKRDGYKRSIELSREYDLYRQNYCGCVFSKRDRESENLIGTD